MNKSEWILEWRALPLSHDDFLQVQSLVKIAKTNFVVMKQLMGGHKKDDKVTLGYSFTQFLLCFFFTYLSYVVRSHDDNSYV